MLSACYRANISIRSMQKYDSVYASANEVLLFHFLQYMNETYVPD